MRAMTDEERRYMLLAYQDAKLSNDRSTQNGAVIVDAGFLISDGYNHIPDKLQKPERFERPLKYDYTIHAERDALYRAAREGTIVEGCDMYCCWAACKECATAIAHAGIRRLHRHVHSGHLLSDDWKASIEVGDTIMREMGVEVITLTGDVGATILFDGKLVEV